MEKQIAGFFNGLMIALIPVIALIAFNAPIIMNSVVSDTDFHPRGVYVKIRHDDKTVGNFNPDSKLDNSQVVAG